MMKLFFTCLVFALSAPFALAQSADDGASAWNKIHEVLTHPRCANCHVGEDNRPRWSGPSYEAAYGLEPGGWTYHGMAINGGDSRIGNTTMPCSTCHQQENSDVEHGPPGAHVWALAPVEMQWFGKSPSEVCARLKSPLTNGGRSLEQVAAHIDNDELVHWGWKPGPGREPAPYGRKEIADTVRAWSAAGAPCPDGTLDVVEYLNAVRE